MTTKAEEDTQLQALKGKINFHFVYLVVTLHTVSTVKNNPRQGPYVVYRD